MNRIITLLICGFLVMESDAQPIGNSRSIVYAMDILPNSRFVAAAVDNSKLEVWNYLTGQLVSSVSLKARGSVVKFAGNSLIVAMLDGTIELLDTLTFKNMAQVRVETGSVTNLIALDRGFAASDDRGNVYISEDPEAGVSLRKFIAGETRVTAMTFLPTMNAIITGHENGKLMFWSVHDGKLLSQQSVASSQVTSLEIFPDHNKLIAAYDKGYAVVYNINIKAYELNKLVRYSPGKWPLAMDTYSATASIGTTEGKIMIYTNKVIYKTRLAAMINAIRIIPNPSGVITVVVGTHGNGIQLLKADKMKMSK